MENCNPQNVTTALIPPLTPRNKTYSILGERPGSVDVQLGNFFSAIESRSLSELQDCIRREPKWITGHGGPFFITPLHFAAEMGWVEGAQHLLEEGASVLARNQYGETPLHYAATAKQEAVVALLLTTHNFNTAVNFQDMKGMSSLHVAAANGCLEVVRLLLEGGALVTTRDKQGEFPLHKAAKAAAFDVMVVLMEAGADLREKDLRGICAIRWLALSTNNGLQNLMDHLLVTNTNDTRASVVTFNFQPLVTKAGSHQCRLLSYFIETGNQAILAHPVCHVFILVKWKATKLISLGYLLYFIVFAALTNLIIYRRWLGKEEPRNVTQELDPVLNSSSSSCSEWPWMQSVKAVLCVMALVLIVLQMNCLRVQGKVRLKTASFWLQLLSVTCVFLLLGLSWNHESTCQSGTWLENHVGAAELLFLLLEYLFILRKFPSYGLYVAMFMRVAKEFLKLFLVYCTLVVCFTAIMFLIVNSGGQKDPVEEKWPLLFLKSVTLMVGSVEVTDSLAEHLDSLPGTGHVLFFFSVVFISIVLANLLVALAVSDIRELRASAEITRLGSMVGAIQSMEQLCDFPLLRYLTAHCTLDAATTHIRLWPKHDTHHPSVMVELRKRRRISHQRPRWFVALLERVCPSRYQVNIPVGVQEEVLARISARRTEDLDPEKLDIPHDYKVFFNEILRRLKLIEAMRNH